MAAPASRVRYSLILKLFRRFGVAAVVGVLCLGALPLAQAPPKSVLVLYAARRDTTGPAATDAVFQRVIANGLHGFLDYYPEYLDRVRFAEPGYQEATLQYLRAKHRVRKFDLIVAYGDWALEFVARHREQLTLDATPMVFMTTTPIAAGPNATGLITPIALRTALDSALAMQPDTKRVYVIGGASAYDRLYETTAHAQFKDLNDRLSFTYLTGLPMSTILEQVRSLPPHSIIFFTTFGADGTGERFPESVTLDRLTAAANAPVYAWQASAMGHGIVGGRLSSSEVLATRLSELALRVLHGERPDDIPVAEIDGGVYQFDWRQMRRWGLSEARIPAGSDTLFRPDRAWDQYREYIIGGASIFLLQAVFITALLVQRRKRQNAEKALRESEERFRLMADTAPVLIWRAGTDKGCEFVNRPWLEFTGRRLEQEIGNGWAEGAHPGDVSRCIAQYFAAFDAREPFRMEYRHRRADGEYRTLLSSGVPRYHTDGRFAGYVGSCLDITDRRQAEDAVIESEGQLRQLAGRLIAAQEDDRARLARDLHDDISQQLAAMALAVAAARRYVKAADGQTKVLDTLSSVQDRTTALAAEVRQLSHTLHPSSLEHSGLVAALTTHCQQVDDPGELLVRFNAVGEFEALDAAAQLCLFRIAQEALRNVVAHAEAGTATVELRRDNGHAELRIVDDGRGFDAAEARARGEGLGLVSILERARLAGGEVELVTAIGEGTAIRVRIPVAEWAADGTGRESAGQRA